jgi:hypothetical protein
MSRIDDGFATIISFANNPTVKFYEKTVTPPGIDGGGPNDTTTMRNTAYRTRAPKKLKSMTRMTATCSYDPIVFSPSEVWAMTNVNQLITVTFPDGSEVSFYGWLDKFDPGEAREGEQPTATVTIECSNQNLSGVETAPVYSAP